MEPDSDTKRKATIRATKKRNQEKKKKSHQAKTVGEPDSIHFSPHSQPLQILTNRPQRLLNDKSN